MSLDAHTFDASPTLSSMDDSASASARLLACTEIMQSIFEHLYDDMPTLSTFKSCRLSSKKLMSMANPWAFKQLDLRRCSSKQLVKLSEMIAPVYGTLVRELVLGKDSLMEGMKMLVNQMGLPMLASMKDSEDEHEQGDDDQGEHSDPKKPKLPKRNVLEDAILAKCVKLNCLSYEFPDTIVTHKLQAEAIFPSLVSTLTSLRIASRDAGPITAILIFFHGEDSSLNNLVYEYMPYEEEGDDDFQEEDQALLEAIVAVPKLENLIVYCPPFLKASFDEKKVKAALKCRNLKTLEHRMSNRLGWEGQVLYSPINPNSLLKLIGLLGESIKYLSIEYHDGLFGMLPPELLYTEPLTTPKLERFVLTSSDGFPFYFDVLRPTLLGITSMTLDIHGEPLKSKILNRKSGNSVMADLAGLYLGRKFWMTMIDSKGLEHAECVTGQIEAACEKEGIHLINELYELCEENPEILGSENAQGEEEEEEQGELEEEFAQSDQEE